MLKKVLLVLITLLIANITLADSYKNKEKTTNFIITPSIAYRYDVFKWSIPNSRFTNYKLSELVWKNRIVQPSIKIELEPQAYQFTFLGEVKYGYILKNQSKSWDHDWLVEKDDATGNVVSKLRSTSKSQATGNVLDLSTAIGYSVGLFKENLLTFYVGYDYSDYRYKNYGYRQLVYKRKSYITNDDLFQKYNYKTYSPWLGLSLYTPITDKLSITPTIKYYSFKHKGKAYWIHRGDFKQDPSFKNNAKGKGIGFELDFIYKYSNNIDLTLNLATKKFKIKKGNQTQYFNSRAFFGERDESDKLFALSLISSSISAGLKYKL